LESFWRKDLEARFKEVGFKPEHVSQLFKEDTMYLPANPHDAYKFGVRQATEPIIVANLADQHVNDVLSDRRKKLLSKKVTKWTGIITSEWSGLPTILELCDTEDEVKGFLAKNPKPLTEAIPIEIEIPL